VTASQNDLEASPTLDPRVLRSRQMLHEALATLLLNKDFDKISIQEIAEASTLNRATFYRPLS
jgi:AcrR family transcriptional regulator